MPLALCARLLGHVSFLKRGAVSEACRVAGGALRCHDLSTVHADQI